MTPASKFHDTGVLVVILLVLVIGFILGSFYQKLTAITPPVKEDVSEWYQAEIKNFIANNEQEEVLGIEKKRTINPPKKFKYLKPNPNLKQKGWDKVKT